MKQVVTDMMNREVIINFPPKKIISVVPSQTELLFELGLDEEVIGITKFCVHPETWFRRKTRIGGTKKLDIGKIKSLQPDLIIANKEENEQSQIEELAKYFPVWISDIKTVDDALIMIKSVGGIVDRKEKACLLVESIKKEFAKIDTEFPQKKVAYFIWYRPWMVVGGDTFISNIIHKIGWINVFQNESRYPEIDIVTLKDKQPEIILLSSEPFPFKQKHIEELKTVLPDCDYKLVDGEMFSWYGSRILKAIPYLYNMQQHS